MLDIKFNLTGSKVATFSSDGTSRIYDVVNGMCTNVLVGHESEILKVKSEYIMLLC